MSFPWSKKVIDEENDYLSVSRGRRPLVRGLGAERP